MMEHFELFYDGRPQGQKHYCEHGTAEEEAKKEIARYEAEYKCAPCYLYQDSSKWEIKF